MVTYRDLFRVREFCFLYTGLVLSYIGDKFAAIAVAVLVFDRTGSAFMSGLAHASAFLPALVAGPLLGPLADRLPRRTLLIACDVLRTATTAGLLLPGLPVGALIVLLYAGNILTAPFTAARSALFPEVLDGEASITANGLNRVTYQLCEMAAFAAGGLAVLAIRPEGALAVNAATFAACACLTAIGVRRRPRALPPRSNAGIMTGVRFLLTDPWLRNCLLLVWLVSMCAHAPEAIIYPYAASLGGGPSLAGLILATMAAGFTLGTVMLTRWLSPAARDRLIVPFAVVAGAALMPLAAEPSLPLVLGLLFVAGLGCGYSAPLNALFVQRVPAELRGRTMSVAIAGITGGQGAGFLLVGLAAGAGLDPGITFALCGLLAALAALAAGLPWRRSHARGTAPAQ
ncbi:MFS transporter [Nonomuraea sp. KM88]|uniref:MFS transporter n=1 Tax=Nonomuraea sp. KM88 TaxID=3457427 RepID=UPI003FCDCDA6